MQGPGKSCCWLKTCLYLAHCNLLFVLVSFFLASSVRADHDFTDNCRCFCDYILSIE
ncbi:hypothetical protein BDV98DRAFT_558530 [Pterulicium gracile]|uniref:Uncharacterized protein n=1 Tax=Pterulicium gracile TaxID=1884261 RepID=A0A5C3R0L1_9AGAR|nr:hypothetical protein BDV98DRAFT_558530 [Pterula gracilis]